MKKIKRFISSNSLYLVALSLALVICAPLVSTSIRPAIVNEQVLVSLSRGLGSIFSLRLLVLFGILLNITLVYGLMSGWFGKKRAGLTAIVLVSIPSWLVMQISMPRFTALLTTVLLAFWGFDRAGRSDKPTGWYALSGLAISAAWLQEPVGITLLMIVCSLLLAAVKPRYVKHITRQASLVAIILLITVGALSGASWKFDLPIQTYLVDHLTNGLRLVTPQVYIDGALNYHVGLPGILLVPLAVMVLAGLGAWQLFVNRKRPRNMFLLAMPLVLAIIAPQVIGLGTVLLLSLVMMGVATWATAGVRYLHSSWQRIFPHNRLANNIGDLLIVVMIATMAVYSFWFVTKAWNNNPEARTGQQIEWNGGL